MTQAVLMGVLLAGVATVLAWAIDAALDALDRSPSGRVLGPRPPEAVLHSRMSPRLADRPGPEPRRNTMNSSDQPTPRVVLARRESGGIRVTLLWAADTNTVAVRARDSNTRDEFELLVEPEVNPIDVYEHPYAYAAWRGIEYHTAGLPQAA